MFVCHVPVFVDILIGWRMQEGLDITQSSMCERAVGSFRYLKAICQIRK